MTSISDEELAARCKTELPTTTCSYEALVQRHMERVYRIAYRVVGNKEDAEDIAQDVFLKVYHGLKTFEQQASFSTWLYRITTNSALDSLEKMRRRQTNVRFFGCSQRNDEPERASRPFDKERDGFVLAEGGGTEPGLIMAKIDPAKVETARKSIPSLQHGRRFSVADPKGTPEHLQLVRGSA